MDQSPNKTANYSSPKHGRDWQWRISDNKYLTLSLADGINYESDFHMDSLRFASTDPVGFSTDDATVFQEFSRFFDALGFDQEYRFRLAISATISKNYLKPLPTRSWYFKLAENRISVQCKPFQLVQLNAQNSAIYVVLSVEEAAANIMLLNPQHGINDVKTCLQGAILKVHIDRFELLDKPFQVSEL